MTESVARRMAEALGREAITAFRLGLPVSAYWAARFAGRYALAVLPPELPALLTPTVVCAWCKVVTKPGNLTHGVSHTICPPCSDKALRELESESAGIVYDEERPNEHAWWYCPCPSCTAHRRDIEPDPRD